MQYIEKGDVVIIKENRISIHNDRIKGKVGIVLGQSDNGKRYKDRQIAVSIPNYKVLHILPMYLEKVNEER